MKKVYFAHPIRMYYTEEEKTVINLIKKHFPNCKIINPANMKTGVTHRGCKQCMREIMRPIFFKHIAKCDSLILWDATGSCGVRCELHEAWRLGKDIIQIELPYLRHIKLQDYHYAHLRKEEKDKGGLE